MNLLILSVLAVASAGGAPQSGGQKPATRINACTVLTRDVIAKVTTPATKTVLNAPQEKPVGPTGSYCDYGGIGLQINPFAGADQARKSPSNNWVLVSGVGDTAYFNNVQNFFAELIVWSGSHHFAIQMEVPAGGTAEQLQPNVIQLAKLIIPKLN